MKVMFHELQAKIFLSNQITELFDHQFLWKECIYTLNFLHEAIYLEKAASETTSFRVHACLAQPKLSQTYHASFSVGLRALPNQKYFKIKDELILNKQKYFFINLINTISSHIPKWILIHQDCKILLSSTSRQLPRKIAYKITTIGWVQLSMPSHAQTCLDLAWMNLVGRATLLQNERLNVVIGNKSVSCVT